jgi:hypothetical protein
MTDYRERRGAHRPKGLGPGGVVPWVLAAVAVLAISVFAVRSLSGDSAADQAGPKPNRSASLSSSTKPTPTKSTPKPTEDRTKPIKVLNSTDRAGLAAKAAATLRTAGWDVRSTGNYQSGAVPTTVFYGGPEQSATAKALADDLGGPVEVTESAALGATAVTVVLGADYPG